MILAPLYSCVAANKITSYYQAIFVTVIMTYILHNQGISNTLYVNKTLHTGFQLSEEGLNPLLFVQPRPEQSQTRNRKHRRALQNRQHAQNP